ncbi:MULTISPECIES: LPS export ABC transporter permease LptG [Enterobacterales]|uniref:LPS export ABC transporter permease LptG n=1 Tax=Enterobacterales TaxID=91347 RepID=UPI000847DD9C|nr:MULTISPECIES: LPS export ABC transporter permease LptG [Enterobacterales]WOO50192.1 LPS export ABC transporter permease LptG [Hafnia alvei]MCK9780306.1 LPS export ABC transporter permease LptG [Proteus columbae]MCT6516367.1 LPS export ABC transporter permease LptG [Proteus vulgaris]ODQ02652.1 lipopolysaccharide ABC transporter permease LptG [Shigella sp. FC130]OEI90938.1 lipopolysaccharide ABC transporter permease LptG [Shigella sp. FC1655]
MFGVLDRYIGRTILQSILMTLFLLVSLSGIIKFVDQLRKVGQGDFTTLDAGVYAILNILKDVQIFFPMAALLGALLGLGALATRSELVVMQASGFTRLQIAGSVMKTAIPLVLLTVLIGEWGAPQGEQYARNYRAEKIMGNSLVSTNRGMWAKDGNQFIHINRIKSQNEMQGITLYDFNHDRKLETVRYASSATYDTNKKTWMLKQVEESDLTDLQKITGKKQVSLEWQTRLTPEKLSVVALDPDALSISGLYQYVKYLKQSGQESANYELNFWKKIFAPISVAVMMLMALSFIFGPLRTVPMGLRVLTGISFGFLFYIVNEVSGRLSLVYGIPAVIAALVPGILFLTLSLWLLMKRNR